MNPMRAKSLMALTFVALAAASAVATSNLSEGQQAEEAGKPNIMLNMADDFGWVDASCYNPEAGFQTFNIDRLARKGIRFAKCLHAAFGMHSHTLRAAHRTLGVGHMDAGRGPGGAVS